MPNTHFDVEQGLRTSGAVGGYVVIVDEREVE
jgi:hypothetical protein